MAIAIIVDGLVTVKITPYSGAQASLGYTRNGVDITFEGFFLDIMGDENGGDDGPPIDVQYLGEVARIRCELTKWDTAVALDVMQRHITSAAGVPVITPGSGLINQDGGYLGLELTSANRTYTFPRCFPRNSIELNKGTKFSTFTCEFEAHRFNSATIYTIS
jgi:hypothetical protein